MRRNTARYATLAGLGFFISVGALIAYRSLYTAVDVPYDVVLARRGHLIQKVSARGTVNAAVTVQIACQVSGRIHDLPIDVNSPVRRGQLLARIDPQPLEAQHTQAQANLAAARALLVKAAVQFQEAERHAIRIRSLFEGGDVSESEHDAAEASVNSAHAQKKAQEAQVTQCEAAVTVATINLDQTTIRSPIDGIVLARHGEVGQIVTGHPQPTILFVVASDLTHLQIEIDVAEADIGKMKVSEEVRFTVDAYPDKPFTGTVEAVHMGPTLKQNVVYYGVIATVANRELLLRPGMTADVSIETAHREHVLLLPVAALQQHDGKNSVDVLDGKGIRERDVTVGLKGSDGFVEIISGLAEGETVIIATTGK